MKVLTLLFGCFLAATASAQEATIVHSSNLRSGPSTSSRILSTLPAGTTATVISRYPRSGYVRVQTSDKNQTGWVLQANTKAGETQGAANAPPAATATPTPVAPPATTAPQPSGTRAGAAAIYPISQQTPGKPDPTVTQDNIAQNICNKSWSTESVRPAVSVTNKIKVQTMKTYGFSDAANHYELDHLISLQNGGCPDCVENLWPEAYGDQAHPMTEIQRGAWNKSNPGSTAILPGSLEKDLVENHIHDEICRNVPNGKMSSQVKKYPASISVTLQRGQQILATDWYACYQSMMNGNKPCE